MTEREEFFHKNREYKNLYKQVLKASVEYTKEHNVMPPTIHSLMDFLYHRMNRKFIPSNHPVLKGILDAKPEPTTPYTATSSGSKFS